VYNLCDVFYCFYSHYKLKFTDTDKGLDKTLIAYWWRDIMVTKIRNINRHKPIFFLCILVIR